MSNDDEQESGMTKEGNIESKMSAVADLAKAIPVYDDLIHPAAKEIGKALETVAKTVNIALAPVKTLVWGYDQIEYFVNSKVSKKLSDTPKEDIITPKLNIAGPALEALRFTGHEESLSDAFANLLASSMDKKTEELVHPSFVDIIKQITSDEAKILKLFSHGNFHPHPLIDIQARKGGDMGGNLILLNFSTIGEEAKCDLPLSTPAYLDNLCRLGLLEIPALTEMKRAGAYSSVEEHSFVKIVLKQIDDRPDREPKIFRKCIRTTEFGNQFITTCIIDYKSKKP